MVEWDGPGVVVAPAEGTMEEMEGAESGGAVVKADRFVIDLMLERASCLRWARAACARERREGMEDGADAMGRSALGESWTSAQVGVLFSTAGVAGLAGTKVGAVSGR